MVSQETVLVVGAGASIPYGFPSGTALVDQVLSEIRFMRQGERTLGTTQFSALLMEAGSDENEIRALQKQLRESQLFSLDAFLESYPGYSRLGKTIIAAALSPRECGEPLFAHASDKDDHWYRYLSNKLIGNIRQGANKRLTILTYNYERSLDHFLRTTIKAALNCTEEELTRQFESLQIIHLHGSLGPLEWQVGRDVLNARPYGTVGNIQQAAEQIKIIYEDHDNTPEYVSAHEALRRAEHVLFLGFGYHRTNVARLRKGGWPLPPHVPCKIEGTCLGLMDGECSIAQHSLGGRIALQHLFSHDCLAFLRHHLPLIS